MVNAEVIQASATTRLLIYNFPSYTGIHFFQVIFSKILKLLGNYNA